MRNCSLLLFLFFLLSIQVPAQQTDCNVLLDKKMRVSGATEATSDSLLLEDLKVIQACAGFDSIDQRLITGPILGNIIFSQASMRENTYRDLFKAFQNFKKSDEYAKAVALMKGFLELENKKVSTASWKHDRSQFAAMGFPEDKLEAFDTFISNITNANLSYKEAWKIVLGESASSDDHFE